MVGCHVHRQPSCQVFSFGTISHNDFLCFLLELRHLRWLNQVWLNLPQHCLIRTRVLKSPQTSFSKRFPFFNWKVEHPFVFGALTNVFAYVVPKIWISGKQAQVRTVSERFCFLLQIDWSVWVKYRAETNITFRPILTTCSANGSQVFILLCHPLCTHRLPGVARKWALCRTRYSPCIRISTTMAAVVDILCAEATVIRISLCLILSCNTLKRRAKVNFLVLLLKWYFICAQIRTTPKQSILWYLTKQDVAYCCSLLLPYTQSTLHCGKPTNNTFSWRWTVARGILVHPSTGKVLKDRMASWNWHPDSTSAVSLSFGGSVCEGRRHKNPKMMTLSFTPLLTITTRKRWNFPLHFQKLSASTTGWNSMKLNNLSQPICNPGDTKRFTQLAIMWQFFWIEEHQTKTRHHKCKLLAEAGKLTCTPVSSASPSVLGKACSICPFHNTMPNVFWIGNHSVVSESPRCNRYCSRG